MASDSQGFQRVWLGDTSTALLAISVVSGWVFAGFYMIIFYAAFRQIPNEVLEAARMDGAGEWALFRRVKVPMIRNAIAVAVLLCVTGGFQGFDLFFVLTNGGPYGATEIPTTYLVKTVFRNGDVGYGSAMAVVLTAIVLGVGLVYTRLHRPRGSGVTGRPDVADPPRGRLPGMLATGRRSSLLAAVFFFPMVWMVLSSFKSNSEIFRAPFDLPTAIDFGRWGEAWEVGHLGQLRAQQRDRHRRVRVAHPDLRLGRGLRIQPLPVPRSGLPDGPVRARAVVAAAVLFHRPVAACSRSSRITDTRLALIIPYAAMGLSLAVYLLKVYLDALPDELFDAARIDGAGDAPGVLDAGPAAPAARSRDGGHLLGPCRVERVPARAAVHPGRRAQDHPDRPAGVLEPLRDRLLAAVLGAVDRDDPDDRHLRRLQPPHRRGDHGRQREVGSGAVRAQPGPVDAGYRVQLVMDL